MDWYFFIMKRKNIQNTSYKSNTLLWNRQRWRFKIVARLALVLEVTELFLYQYPEKTLRKFASYYLRNFQSRVESRPVRLRVFCVSRFEFRQWKCFEKLSETSAQITLKIVAKWKFVWFGYFGSEKVSKSVSCGSL